jgi:molybdopterin/thiamine biosynthesis adenylyltransferase
VRPEDSRTIRLAARAAGGSESELEQRLARSVTHVAVDPGTPGSLGCAEVLITTLQRGLGQVSIDPDRLSSRELQRLRAAAAAVRPERHVLVGRRPPGASSIAIGAAPGDIWIVPDAHGVRLSRHGVPEQYRPPSSLGMVFTAAVANAELFKDAAAISSEHCARHDELAFCPVTLSSDLNRAAIPGPEWRPIVILAGVGAIGTAHALILGGLTHRGGAVLIDRQSYAPENLGTYSLGVAADVLGATAKTTVAQRTLNGWRCHAHTGEIADAIARIDRRELPWAAVALAGLDNHSARRDAQRLQVDRLLDAATGDTTVGLRDTRPEGPCLSCMLPAPPTESPTDALVALGIPPELAHAPGNAVVDEAMIASAPTARARAVLSAQRGTQICGLLRAAGLSDLDANGFMPSVPFVSQQAACLSVGRLIAIATRTDAGQANFFQYDVMFGPARAISQRRAADPSCSCRQRSDTIAQVRRERRLGPLA